VWPLAAILAAAVLIDGYVMYRTVAARTLPEVYVSNWYILGAFCYLPILYVTSYLPWYQGGLGNATRSSRATTCTTPWACGSPS
jgi:cytochrome c oxidase cbb3-type subunit 1